MLTTDPNDPALNKVRADGQFEKYIVLSSEERAKGFVRPVRRAYRHVGPPPPANLRDLTPEEKERWPDYVKFEDYPPERSPVIGRGWTQQQLNNRGCGTETRMGLELCETYARNPKFYGATFCCGCRTHLPVEEFVWVEDGARVGS